MTELNTIDEMIEVLEGYKQGKTVQIDIDGTWSNLEKPTFGSFGFHRYRLKPEPRELNIKEDEQYCVYDKNGFMKYCEVGPAKFVEVLE